MGNCDMDYLDGMSDEFKILTCIFILCHNSIEFLNHHDTKLVPEFNKKKIIRFLKRGEELTKTMMHEISNS